MSKPIETFKLETNFEGLILLLAKHLYSEPDVFVRELIANAHDAIQNRGENKPYYPGQIEIIINNAASTISFIDNGVGMDDYDLKNTLSVIGESSKRRDREKALAQIGQFGIGLLSSFIVANRVVVNTRKMDHEKAFAWQNEGSLECQLFDIDQSFIGTEVVLSIREDYAYLLNEEKIEEIARKYCDFIPYPIYVNGRGPINDFDIPIYKAKWSDDLDRDLKLQSFINRRYSGEVPLDIIPISIDGDYRATGVLFVSDRHIPGIHTAGIMDIFIKRMFIRENDTTLLPEWAKFIRGLIDCQDFKPTAARDSIIVDDAAFKYIREKLSDIIIDRLCWLAEHDIKKLERINRWHHDHLKSMAVYSKDFLLKAGDLIFVETNEGMMPIGTYLTKNNRRIDLENKVPIYYFTYHGSASQFFTLAKSKSWIVINAGYRYDVDFLKVYSESSKNKDNVVLINLDSTDDPEIFKRLSAQEEERFKQLETDIKEHLNRVYPATIIVKMRDFEPRTLPAIVIDKPEESIDRKIAQLETAQVLYGGEMFSELIQQAKSKPTFILNINSGNYIIEKLLEIDRKNEIVKEIISGLFISAILYSRSLNNEAVSQYIYEQFANFFNNFIKLYEDNLQFKESLDQHRKEILEIKQSTSTSTLKSIDHIQIYLITPFEKEYDPLWEAFKIIFENPPYCFEVISNKNFEQGKRLLDNFKANITNSDCFFIETSNLDPEVMFQLGVVHALKGNNCPIITLRNQDSQNFTPADIKEDGSMSYVSIQQSLDLIVEDLKEKLEKNNKPIHKDILTLLTKRKRHFLSRKILEGTVVRLDKNQADNILIHYKTLEDYIEDDLIAIKQKTRIEARIADFLKDEFRNVLNGML